jgi:hypothetical protein
VSRSLASILAVLVTLLAGVTLSATAVAAATPAPGPPVAAVDATPGEDDPIGVDLGDLCVLLAEADAGDESDAPDATSRAATAPDEPAADPDEDNPIGGEDPADTANAIDCAGDLTDEPDAEPDRPAASKVRSKRPTLADVLKKGSIATGPVTMAGAGTITQELWLDPGRAATKRIVASAAASKRTAKKPKGRILGGTLTRTVKQAGVVHLTVRLNAAGRKALRRARKDVRITVKTITKLRGAKARTHSSTLLVPVKPPKQ